MRDLAELRQWAAERSAELESTWKAIQCTRCGHRETVALESTATMCERCREQWRLFRENTPARYRTAALADLPAALVERFRSLRTGTGIFLWGTPGAGKTHALFAFRRDLWERCQQSRRAIWDDLLLEIRDSFRPRSHESESAILRRMVDAPVLMLDDVGVLTSIGATESDFSTKVFLHILDRRLEACRPTFITSNKSVENLGASFDQRIYSRLLQACQVIRLAGRDRRQDQIGGDA
ncbi:MAG: ATP-binding protein [Phycisphaerales bacterium]